MIMNRRTFLTGSVAAAAVLAGGPALAGGITVHFLGDSITRGYGAGVFSNEIGPDHPFWPMRSMWAVADAIFEENGSPFIASYLSSGNLHPTVGPPRSLQEVGQLGILQPHDWVVLEDAGVHPDETHVYRDGWLRLIDDIRTVPNVNILMMTMFDYPPAQPLAQYDLPFNGGTMNQATTEAAQLAGVTLIDMNLMMDWFKARAPVPVMLPDGVHPNVWGQAFMTGQILKAVGARPYIRSVNLLWSQIRPHWQRYGYGTSNWSERRCCEFLKRTLLITE